MSDNESTSYGAPHPEFTRSLTATTALLRQYLEETGLTAAAALEAWEWGEERPIYSAITLTPAELLRHAELSEMWGRYRDYAWNLETPEAATEGAKLSEEDQRAIRALWESVDPAEHHGQRDALWWVAQYPPNAQVIAELDALEERAITATMAKRAARLAELLTVGGVRHPDPWTWLEPRIGGLLDPYYPASVALERLAREEAEQRADAAEQELGRAPSLLPLRIGTRALKTATARRRDFRDAVRSLARTQKLTPEERLVFEQAEPAPLRGEEIVVVAGLLWIAQQNGALRRYGPARFRAGNVVAELWLTVEHPKTEEFCRLVLGYPTNTQGRVSGDDRKRVEDALRSLTEARRPLLCRSAERRGSKWEEHWDLQRAVPIRENTRDDGVRTLELHPALVAGYWHGHVRLEGITRQWDDARRAIGARYLDDQMRWADLYFRQLAIGVQGQCIGNALKAIGAPRKVDAGEDWPAWRRRALALVPEAMEKRISTRTILERLELEAYRQKKGPADTRKRLGKIFDFCRATGSISTWAPDGSCYTFGLPRPVGGQGEDDGPEQIHFLEALEEVGAE